MRAAVRTRTRSARPLQGDWFSESMFVRFVPLQITGRWKGRSYG